MPFFGMQEEKKVLDILSILYCAFLGAFEYFITMLFSPDNDLVEVSWFSIYPLDFSHEN